MRSLKAELAASFEKIAPGDLLQYSSFFDAA